MNKAREEWRTVAEFPRYEVSSLGRIRNSETGHVLSQRKNWKGYLVVTFSERHRSFKRYTARVVCIAFNGEPPLPDAQAAHLDGSRDNNVPANIVWVTSRENNRHKVAHGTYLRGSRCPNALLNESQVLEIKDAILRGSRNKAIAARYGVRSQTITNIRSGFRWGWLTGFSKEGSGASAKAAPVNE